MYTRHQTIKNQSTENFDELENRFIGIHYIMYIYVSEVLQREFNGLISNDSIRGET